MIQVGYLERLTLRLIQGASRLDSAFRDRHRDYFLAAQRPDGGFAGREGTSDLYYTGFALRGLATLAELQPPASTRAASFLRSRVSGKETAVDLLSLIYGASLLERMAGEEPLARLPEGWKRSLAEFLEIYRKPDGGYAKTPQGAASSVYHSFLTLLCLEAIEVAPRESERLIEFLKSHEDAEGGYHEIRVSKRPGVNPTAAAVASLRMLGAFDEEARERTLDYLVETQSDDGGFTANTRIPFADLLSTFTALVTLVDLDAAEEVDLVGAKRFARSLEIETGGFRGAALDPGHDVEYAFYGVGAFSLLAYLEIPREEREV
jgi:geranylgeranyl transferase type-2 subunit beta